ncbi:E3 ubiquitin-protein ligase TRIM35-like [Pseudoliparis swirei]|uniref:E3 ubiquitin-protein ligase TRIM35-like n=1 Tax=Pseudoliparis swirei TaxID=2059687 RepID=UPI0024BEB46C|nr:E3 ubiquitin-protein ligase TRIM35-like [Pseudoliparis swirei]
MSCGPEEDLCCSVCCELFRNPVVLSCSHSFCKECLTSWWRMKPTRECPVCKRRSSKSDPPRNLALKNLSEAFSKKGRGQSAPETLCGLHSEKFRLFCLDHRELVCVVCRDSRRHADHRFKPVDEAAQDFKTEIRESLKPLKEKLKLFEDAKANCDQTAAHVEVQARRAESHIKEQIKKLHRFLEEEEEARISAVREEEKQKRGAMKEKTAALSREIAALSAGVGAAEDELRADDIQFLGGYAATAERVQRRPLLEDPQLEDPQLPAGALLDEAKHLGNLSFNIWSKMQDVVSYAPVVLDPNTADSELVVSTDLTGVTSGKGRRLPENAERTRFPCSVLGSEGFDSGSHSWDLEVGDNADWELGVLGEDVQTDGRLRSALWRIQFSGGKLTAFATSDREKDLPEMKELRRVRVHLDFSRGRLSFGDLDTRAHIHTFKHGFKDTVFPYVYTEDPLPLKILPVKVTVKVERFTLTECIWE